MSEYGTGRGGIARRPDGSSKELKPNEVAMVERMKALRDVPSFSEPRMDTVGVQMPDGHWEEVTRPFAPDVAKLAELQERTNGYHLETKSDLSGE